MWRDNISYWFCIFASKLLVLTNIPDDQVKFGSEEKGTFYFADMEKVLQSIFVHVDAAYNTLADKAIAQLLVKLLYMCDHPLKILL